MKFKLKFIYCFVLLPLLCFPDVRKGLSSHLPQLFIDLLRGRNDLSSLFIEKSGTYVLPKAVQQAAALLEINSISEFSLSKAWMKDDELKQRAIEGLFPKLYRSKSPYQLIMKGEIIQGSCKKLNPNDFENEEVLLVFCS